MVGRIIASTLAVVAPEHEARWGHFYELGSGDGWWGLANREPVALTKKLGPIEARGTVDGVEWFLQAREADWTFTVAEPPYNVIWTASEGRPGGFHMSGKAKVEEFADVWPIVDHAVSAYRMEHPPPGA